MLFAKYRTALLITVSTGRPLSFHPNYLLAMSLQSTIVDVRAQITGSCIIGQDVSVISMDCPEIASKAVPGNFVNIKVNATGQPLLRRPFCIHNVNGTTIEVMVKSIGCGTSMLCSAPVDSSVLVLGPLGNSFNTDTPEYETALLVSGGIGTAPMLFLEKKLAERGRKFHHLLGGRSRGDLLTRGLSNFTISTDDGSEGFKGNVVELLRNYLASPEVRKPFKVFACGPNPMLKALAGFCREQDIPCELSLESIMGCGIGICYGCMIELSNAEGEKESVLLCREGPVIDGRRLIL